MVNPFLAAIKVKKKDDLYVGWYWPGALWNSGNYRLY